MNAAGWIVAGYAAVVSTASLAWQVWSWHLARRNRVEVKVEAALLGLDDGEMVDAVSVEVVNRSDHAVRVTGVGLDLQDGSGHQMHQMHVPPGATLPGTVASRDSGSTFFLAEDIKQEAEIDIYGPIAGCVHLSTGETVKSKPKVTRTRG
jgi:hypothetical protein